MSLPLLSAALLAAGSPVATLESAPPPGVVLTLPQEASVFRGDSRLSSTASAIALTVDSAGLANDDQVTPSQSASPAPTAIDAPTAIEASAGSDGISAGDLTPEADGGDLVVQAREQTPADPFENVNAETYQVVAKVDEALVEPVAEAYRDGLPRGLRRAISNFFANLREPVYALNFLLQLKPGKAVETLARFAINSTIGVAGIIDVADDRTFGLPRRRNGFANTLGYYGVGQGPFIVLPLVGATTLRDMIGNGIDQIASPATLVGGPLATPYYGVTAFTVSSLDYRIETDDAIEGYRSSDDPYVSMRESYLARRRNEIEALHGRGPLADGAPPTTAAPAVSSPPGTDPVTVPGNP